MIKRLEAQNLLMAAVDVGQYMGAGGIAFLSGKWKGGGRKNSLFASF